jgi:glycosyltransferase involved in cell wall biosynthesis
LATYNGAEYLSDLLDSILTQTYVKWRLIVRDDGSSDNTLSIIEAYKKKHEHIIKVLDNKRIRLGACASFSELMEYSTADYIMFCDQDDVWLENKIESLLAALQDLEIKQGKNTPILIHSDLTVTNAQLEILAHSFWRYQHLLPSLGSSFPRLLMQNVVTGCAAVFNRSAKECALPLPRNAIMHDWWLALVVSAFGYVQYLPGPTVLYRQHTDNVTGAKKYDLQYILGKILSMMKTKDLQLSISRSKNQAKALLDRYGKELKPEHRAAASAMAHIDHLGAIAKRQAIWRHRLLKNGFIRNFALFLRI